MNKTALIILIVTNFLISCQEQKNKTRNVEILNTIWETMNTQYFDSTFKGEVIITSVEPNSAASEMNIQPGFTLCEINGKTIDQIVKKRKSEPTPPLIREI